MRVWLPVAAAIAVVLSMALFFAGTSRAAIGFEDATANAGIGKLTPTYGAAWGDFDGNGLPDLWVGNHFTTPSLYLNQGDGTFQDQANQVWPGPIRDTHGTAWADVDRDGDQDLIEIVGGANENFLWINESGVFVDRAAEWGIQFANMRSRTPLWLDWNGDSILDLVLGYEQNATVFPSILRGTGSGFVDATAETGVARTSTNYLQLGDLDANGEADLIFEGAYFPSFVYDLSTTPFVDVRDQLELDFHGDDFASDSVIADFSGDGRNDLFFPKQGANFQLVIVDSQSFEAKMHAQGSSRTLSFRVDAPIEIRFFPEFSGSASSLIKLGAAGTPASAFVVNLDPMDPTLVGIAPHTPGAGPNAFVGFDPLTGTWEVVYSAPFGLILNFVVTSQAPMQDVTAVDWDADPLPSWPNYYESTPTGFEERRSQSGFGMGAPCNSVVSGDFDNDMDLDLYLACTRPVANAPNMLFENQGDGTFLLVPNAAGAAGSVEGRSDSVVKADYDEDGFLDLFVTNGEGGAPFSTGPHELFRNLGNSNHWLEVDLVGCASNREGIGAVVTAEAGGVVQSRLQDGGMHRRSQNYARLHFGLGPHTLVDQLQIRWPSGTVDVMTSVSADQILSAVEGGGMACAASVPSASRTVMLAIGVLLGLLGGGAILRGHGR